ncbi:DUF6801 domain-containing protein [Streptomyces angustmyceticus]|uniref:DUF6801 domain-containing protein n=1 Tax=Streptomyces angustmyceticus TaxID=285578 RepID=UPI0021AF1236|nr:DUF6801 domain-containing protein [Streptomyces angustmyceticus]
MTGAGTAAAQPVSHTLKYTCKVPVIKSLPFTVRIDADIPRSVAVGEASRKFAIGARTTVDADLTAKLRFLGVKTVTGRVVAKIGVSAPQGDRRLRVPLGITRTRIPASGSFDVAATGAAPALTFSRPGKARITVGDIALHVVGKKANGAALGEVDAGCRLNAGQRGVVGSFQITGAGTGAGAGAGKANGSTRSGSSATAGVSGMSGAPGTSDGSTPSGGSGTSAKGTTVPGATPERTSLATDGTATGTTATTGRNARTLVLPIAGTLVVAALAFCFGAWHKNRRRAADGD